LDTQDVPAGSAAGAALAAIGEYKQKAGLDFILRDSESIIADSLEGASRVVEIVKTLKSFSHPDSRRKEAADLNAGIESTLKLIWNELKYKAEIEKDLGDIGLVECYPQQINQVFLNLLVNAGQAIEKTGKIFIRTRKEGDSVVVEIRDTGCGIAPENLSRVFDPFFTTKPVGKGTGLGLSLVYGIVHKHGGRIDVASEAGKGTAITVRLPVKFTAETE
jgi:signal transduction histidine kinase